MAEMQTDPLLKGWYRNSNGYENADLCQWNFGTMFNGVNTDNGVYKNSNVIL
eukprot:gene56244-75102_t